MIFDSSYLLSGYVRHVRKRIINMSESNFPNLSDSIAKSLTSFSGKSAGLKTLSERMLDIQSDSLKSTQLGIAKIFESYHVPDAVTTMASFTENIKRSIPKIDMPIGTIAAMQDLQKTAFAALQASMPDLPQIASAIGASMMRFQTISAFLKCCETTTWPLFFIASDEMERDLAHYADIFSDGLGLVETINEYAIDYLDRDKIDEILNNWKVDDSVSSDKKPLLERAIKHHHDKDYYASTSILMCQVSGLIEDCDSKYNALASCDEEGLKYMARHLGLEDGIVNRRKGRSNTKDQLAAITYGVESRIYYWEASARYIATVTLANNPNEELYSTNPLRNKICHGSQVNYGSVIHSLKAILVVDLLIRLSRSFRSGSDDG